MIAALRKFASRFSIGGYDAAQTSNRRASHRAELMDEDSHARAQQRKRLVSGARDIRRQFEVARWAINKHLDWISAFSFQCRHPDRGLNRAVEDYIEARSKREAMDVTARHPRRRFARLMEASRVVDGDVFAIRLADGRTQAIEGDRVRDPDRLRDPNHRWKHGVHTDAAGRATHIAVHRRSRGRGGFEFERTVPMNRGWHHAAYDRFDQVRGISEVTSALNRMRDLYEGADYALAKMKIAQLYGLVIFSESDEGLGTHEPSESLKAGQDKYQVDAGKGPFKLELEPGEKMEMVESRNPSTEFREFYVFCIQVALKALNIPYSFWDEAHTNFFGSRAALMNYLRSCQPHRENLQDWHNDWSRWQIQRAMADGDLLQPSGITDDEFFAHMKWAPSGAAWWNPLVEVRANQLAVEAKFRSRSDIVLEQSGRDWRDVCDEIAAEDEYLRSKGYDPTSQIDAHSFAEDVDHFYALAK